jgi:PadR family transcriptional regulator PadR
VGIINRNSYASPGLRIPQDTSAYTSASSFASPEKNTLLQHFEFAVVGAVNSLKKKAYPAEISRFLSSELSKQVSLAQVFVSLERLEDKGFVSSEVIIPEPVRGGRRRRVFQVEASGIQAWEKTAAAFTRMSSLGAPLKERLFDAETEETPSPA